MKQETLLNIIGIIGVFLTSSGFIEGINPYIKFPSMFIGVIAIGVYAKMYYDDKIAAINKQNTIIQEQIRSVNFQLEKMKGWIECAQHFFPTKGRKGALNPFILIIIIIIIIAVITWVQKGG